MNKFYRVFIGEPCRVSSTSMEIDHWDWRLVVDRQDQLWRLYTCSVVRYSACRHLHMDSLSAKKDMETNWGYHCSAGLKMPQENDLIVFKNPENKEGLLV